MDGQRLPQRNRNGHHITALNSRDALAPTRSHTQSFLLLRKTKTSRSHLEENRLQKRLEKLSLLSESTSRPRNSQRQTSSSSNPSFSSSTSNFLTATIGKSQRRAAEQAITPWQEDSEVTECPICHTPFSFSNRKHHCRVCGRVVCGIPSKRCSSEMILVDGFLEQAELDDPAAIRICTTCRVAVSGRKELEAERQNQPRYIVLYDALMRHRKEIEATLPKFQEMIVMLRNKDAQKQTPVDFQEASKARKQLLEAFAKFDALAKQIRVLDPQDAIIRRRRSGSHARVQSGATQQRLQNAIHNWANQFLQLNMFPLEALPKLMKAAAAGVANGRASPASSDASSARNQIGTAATIGLGIVEDEKIAVMDEQIHLVEGYAEEAQKRRKWEDWKVLKDSLAELKEERRKMVQGLL